jgi:hypothetical protein
MGKYKILLSATALLLQASVAATEEAHHEAGASEGGHHPNLIAVFTGVTHNGRRENDPALGLEYERRINERFGIGALAEYTFSDHGIWVYAVPFAYHHREWKFYIAPGVEDGEHGSERMIRLGAEYAFELKDGWEISPQIDVDFVDGEDVWVFGLTFGKGF